MTQHSSQPETQSLRMPHAMERLEALEAEREKLLIKASKVQASIERLLALVEKTNTEVETAVLPILHELSELQRETHALFRELLLPGRLAKGPHRRVKQLYTMLLEDEFLDPFEDVADEDSESEAENDETEEQRESERERYDAAWREGLPYEHETGATSAPRDAKLADALRAVFRRLVRALHPDTVQDPAEQARRTMVMKEITQAHQLEDLARLLEIERAWLQGAHAAGHSPSVPSVDETERRCIAISETIAALKVQVRTLERELRSLRKSEPVQLMNEMKRGAKPISTVVESASEELNRYRDVRNLVKNFRDGKATLRELLDGPDSLMDVTEDFNDAKFVVFPPGFDEFMGEIFGSRFDPTASPHKRAKRKR
jgi:hypothetical protein